MTWFRDVCRLHIVVHGVIYGLSARRAFTPERVHVMGRVPRPRQWRTMHRE